MYIPPHFAQDDPKQAIAFMQRFNFATLVSQHDRPIATHLPFVIAVEDPKIVLRSHMAIANPQWKSLAEQEVLVIFAEPHAYISPRLYQSRKNVPTWNYAAVHAYGQAKLLESEAEKRATLEALMEVMEPAYLEQWAGLDESYRQRLYRGMLAFEIEVTELQAKEKLSQNKSEIDRQNVTEHLAQSEDGAAQLTAELMRRRAES